MIETTLAELTINITDGKHGDCQEENDSGFYFISCKDVKDGQINYSAARQITEKDFLNAHKRTMLEPNDILITNSGTIGRMAFIKDIPETYRTTFQKSVAIVKPNGKRVLPLYLYYQLQNYVVDFINQSNGSAQKNLLLSTMRAFKLCIHADKSVQRRIAESLCAYDDLIENNQKQIKLLEEAAQRLYKEWFVDLRFPGYETTPVVDGVPKGWQWDQLSDIATVNKRSISKDYPFEYVDYIDISSVSSGRIETKTRYSLQKAPGRAKRMAYDGDVIWGMVRPNLKSYALMFHPSATTVVSTGFAVLSAERVPFSFLYCHVTQDEFVGYLVNCTNGAAYPAVKPIHFEKAPVLVPKSDIVERFHSLTEPMFRKAELLSKQIDSATEARDHLLPKLMNGEIEV